MTYFIVLRIKVKSEQRSNRNIFIKNLNIRAPIAILAISLPQLAKHIQDRYHIRLRARPEPELIYLKYGYCKSRKNSNFVMLISADIYLRKCFRNIQTENVVVFC